jgi:hypothetical protein
MCVGGPEGGATTNGDLGSIGSILELSIRWVQCLGSTLPTSVYTSIR